MTAVKSNCLQTLYPKISEEWHPTKNGDLTPLEITPGSGKKVWWKCNQGDDHEWEAVISDRSSGNGCPFCSGRQASSLSSLASTNPILSNQWHPTKNGELTPSNFTEHSNEEVWWKCDQGDDHEWEASINNRSKGQGCSICRGLTVVKSNCLATLNPTIAKEWHPTKNGALTPRDVTISTGRKVWWKCDVADDHEWHTSVASRSAGTGCSKCAEYGFNPDKPAFFYARDIEIKNKRAIKFGITNQLSGNRERQQKQNFSGRIRTVFKIEMDGNKALEIESKCKSIYGKKGYLSKDELPDGYTETIKYSEESLNKIKSIVDEVLTEKAEKKK